MTLNYVRILSGDPGFDANAQIEFDQTRCPVGLRPHENWCVGNWWIGAMYQFRTMIYMSEHAAGTICIV